jgi:hypothetical protein
MADIRLARIAPVGIAMGRTEWGQHRRQDGQNPPRKRPGAQAHLLSLLLPERDPETCELDYVVNAAGDVVALVIRDASSGQELARVPASSISSLAGGRPSSGLLFEMKG